MQQKTDPRRAQGTLLLIQETRFGLLTSDGRGLFFALSPSARSPPGQLQAWYRARVPIVVDYEGEPGLESAVAHAIRPLG